MVYDLTALGSYVCITAREGSIGGSEEIVIRDFPGDATVVNIDDFEAGSLEFDVNGESYRKATVKPIRISISLIPNCDEDVQLNRVALRNTGYRYSLFDLNIHYSSGLETGTDTVFDSVSFRNGVLCSVSKGFSIAGSGRIETRVYTFQFPPPGFDGEGIKALADKMVSEIDAQTYLQTTMNLA